MKMNARNKPGRGGVRQGAGRSRSVLYKIGFSADDALFQRIEKARGEIPRNAFLRELIDRALRRPVGDEEKREIVKNFFAMLGELERGGGLPDKIVLAIYESDADLLKFRPDELWESAGAHADLMAEIALEVAREYGARVEIETRAISSRKYGKWLKKNGYADDAARRAEFVSLSASE